MPRAIDVARSLFVIPHAASLLRRHGRPAAVLYFGVAPGDDLLATAVLRQWSRVRGGRAAYLTNHPALFEGNPDVAWTAPYSPHLAGALAALGVPRRRLKYHDYDPAQDRSLAGPDHIVNLMCASAGLPPTTDVAPRVFLSDEERRAWLPARRRVAVQSSALSAAMPIRTKEWFPDRMQEVVAALAGEVEIVQLGSPSDPRLHGTVDLRGRTTIREAAAVLAGASAFVGMVGFLMHLARAVATPSVIVYGGREHPSQSGYPENHNLHTDIHCSPCWLWNRCPYGMECMRRISAADVTAALAAVLRT
jgi:hypothetical protein